MPRSAAQIFMGIIFILFGIVGLSIVSSFPWQMMGTGPSIAQILIPAIPIAVGVFLIIGGGLPKPIGIEIGKNEPAIVQEKVLVKIRCPYCGGLYDETLDKCPNCGGTR